MRRVVYGEKERLKAFAERIIKRTIFTEQAHFIGNEIDGEIAAVAIFDRFVVPVDCELSIASDGEGRWLDRRFAKHVAAYPFSCLGLQRVTAFIEVENYAARVLACRLGFQSEGLKRHADSSKGVMMFGLLRSECRWATLPLLTRAA